MRTYEGYCFRRTWSAALSLYEDHIDMRLSWYCLPCFSPTRTKVSTRLPPYHTVQDAFESVSWLAAASTRHSEVMSDQSRQSSQRTISVHCLTSVYPIHSSESYLQRKTLRFLRMYFVRRPMPSSSSPTGAESKTSLRESCLYLRREALGSLRPRTVCRGTVCAMLLQSGLGFR